MNSYGQITNLQPRINCRLPQTFRTPTTAAAHYFDDIFSRNIKPLDGHSPAHKHMRRSSTSRSIGARSSIATTEPEPETPEKDKDGDQNAAKETDGLNGQLARGEPENSEVLQRREEADQRVASYVSDQVQRVKRRDSVAAYDDEFETRVSDS